MSEEIKKSVVSSMTNQGLAIEILIFLSQVFKLNILPTEIQGVVMSIVTLAGFIMIFWGRYRKGDLFIKKQK